MHYILSNIPQTGTNLPYIPPRNGSYNNVFNNSDGIRSSPGFTLLQAHIQLMAMVPHLPENELSPRSSRLEGSASDGEGPIEVESLPQLDIPCPRITPRFMPSASKFKRTRSPSSQTSLNKYQSPASWHSLLAPRTVSYLSLPPKPGKPIANPPFGKSLSGSKRVPENGMFPCSSSSFQQTPSNYGYETTQVSSTLERLLDGMEWSEKNGKERSAHKTRTKCGTAKVFDVLHDLNPDEVRLYTCEHLVELLSSSDWSNCHLGLETVVRLARHRPNILFNYLNPILWYAFKHLTSPKSALCRAAIITFSELFKRIGTALDNDLEKLTEKLVVKSLAPNMFIREECERALDAMMNHCSLIKVLGAIEGVSKKGNMRSAYHRLAGVTKQFIKVAGVNTCLKPNYAEKLLPMLFNFMTEANIQTRTAAKEALALLMNHLQFEAAVTRHITFDRNCTEVFKKLDKMRGRNKNRIYHLSNRTLKE